MSAGKVAYLQSDRPAVVADPGGRVYRKRARIVAIRQAFPFTVETDRGVMSGEPGDYLVTNHPDDDPGSDLWSISAERMDSTYEPAE